MSRNSRFARAKLLALVAGLTATALAGSAAGSAIEPDPPPDARPEAPSTNDSAPSPPPFRFRDVTAASGVDFEHPPSPDKQFIMETTSGGVALFDYDRDGLLDIYLVDSLTVETLAEPERARSTLYRNLGEGRFEDVSKTVGATGPGWGMGVCVADFDGDGFQDLYVTGLEHNRLYRNDGGRTFRDVTEGAGVAGGGWSTGCGFADYDRDGDLDLFVSRYIAIDFANLPKFGQGQLCTYRDIPVHCGPRGLPGLSDLLFRNDGEGRFSEVAEHAGVADPGGMFGLGIAWFDFDDDGWLDLFVANDTTPNFLYRNRRDGTFEESAHLLGVAVSEDGKQQGSMGVALGDERNSGRQSLFVTNFAEEYNAFYRDQGGYFADASFSTTTAQPSLPRVGWGTAFLDADNDGWLDLLLVNGHVYPQMKDLRLAGSAPYRQRRLLYRNRRDGTFADSTEAVGDPLTVERVSRGLAVGDLDNDGRLDVVINNLDGPAEVWRNETPEPGNWLLVRLVGGAGMTDALGAHITLRSGDLVQTRSVRSGTSYLSQDDMRQHFGLGRAPRADAIEVRWPDGSTSRWQDIAANQLITLEPPQATPAPPPSPEDPDP